jgi:predicted aspartyl protease
MLLRADGQPFATGAVNYLFRPATEQERSLRITIDIRIRDFKSPAFIDTGGIYLICPPEVADVLDLQPEDVLFRERILLRGLSIAGSVYRLPLTLIADRGNSIIIEATAFVPDDEHLDWDNFPCILGMEGCLERLCFAVDPVNEIFYFGESS